MNGKKICFISCVNNESLYEENLKSIKNLSIPEGYEVEIIGIRDAKSMTSGYNQAMEISDAKYKVYTHQDVVILNKKIVSDILNIFRDNSIGIIGVIGSKRMPSNGVWTDGLPLYGRTSDMYYGQKIDNKAREPINDYEEVALLDGLILITQYDIPWRDDIFKGWHFYDASQCTEMRLGGKKVVVPKQHNVWVHHNNKGSHAPGFDIDKETFIKEYSEGNRIINNRVSIIIVINNELEKIMSCIESIRNFTNPREYEIIVVDNNSTDMMRDWLRKQENIKTVVNEKSDGYIKGVNLGLKVANINHDILLLNCDTVVTPRWLENLKECLNSDEKIGIVGPMTNYFVNEQGVQVNYKNLEEMIEFAHRYNTKSEEGWEEKVSLNRFCLLVKRKVFEKVGLYLDELFSPGLYEDIDLCIRIIQQGYKPVLCRNTFIQYNGYNSFSDNKEINQLRDKNRGKYYNKWGFDADSESFIKGELICNIYEPQSKELNILQYNCGLGSSLLKLKLFFPCSQFFGIENNEKLTSISKNLINISTEDIDNLVEKFPGTKFNYVILGDINEDIYELDILIKNISKHMKKDGYIIATVRNLLHFNIFKELLNGDITRVAFTEGYKDLLTKEEFIRVFNENGFVVTTLNSANIGGSDEKDNKLLSSLMEYSLDKSSDKFIAYKYIGKFKKIK